MGEIKTGGPEPISLRDMIAVEAMGAFLSGDKSHWAARCVDELNHRKTATARTIATLSYQMADEMLRAREGAHHD